MRGQDGPLLAAIEEFTNPTELAPREGGTLPGPSLWDQVLAGVTRHAAAALGLADRGRLTPGLRADISFWKIGRPAELCYALGANPCVGVLQGGKWRAS